MRWIAVAGQATAVFVANYWLGLDLEILPMLALMTLSVVVNLITPLILGPGVWLSERAARWFLGYDLLQIGGLLLLCGGLANPFALLILAPVTVSASALSTSSTAALASLAVVLETLLAIWHVPLPWFENDFSLDPLFVTGLWTGLVLATVFIASYVGSLASERRALADGLAATQAALAREQRLASLGGLAAAVAHELGTPLSTIMLVSRELRHDCPDDSPLREDFDILVEEAERCRALLTELAEKPRPDSGDAFNLLPIRALIDLAAQPFLTDSVVLDIACEGEGPEPSLPRDPAVVHGLGTLLQNALQFAKKRVHVTIGWRGRDLQVIIVDDGPGFAPSVLQRLGEPYLSSDVPDPRQDYDPEGQHMGLGVFIAQTLLNHAGARLAFSNGQKGGAKVAISWHLAQFASEANESRE